MGFCVIKNENNLYLGKELEEFYSYSEHTQGGGILYESWRDLRYFMGDDQDESGGLIIFENTDKAAKYIGRSVDLEIVLLKDLTLI